MKHLLIIEDDQIDQMAFERFANTEDFNYSYKIARSIKEAKEALKTTKFDAVISDYFLGDGNAFEILEMEIDIPIISGSAKKFIPGSIIRLPKFILFYLSPKKHSSHSSIFSQIETDTLTWTRWPHRRFV